MVRRVAIYVFDDAEELDVVGPFEVFGMAGRLRPGSFEVYLMAKSTRPVRFRYGLTITPDRALSEGSPFDILLVPGGKGARAAMKDEASLAMVRKAAEECELVASVCTGALVLASAGLLKGKRATTHWSALEELASFEGVRVEHRRFIRQGKVVTSGGISAGIDMALALVGSLEGAELKKQVARHMEYAVRS
jgi:transcriptional regulator GlxA family with amidase domain